MTQEFKAFVQICEVCNCHKYN